LLVSATKQAVGPRTRGGDENVQSLKRLGVQILESDSKSAVWIRVPPEVLRVSDDPHKSGGASIRRKGAVHPDGTQMRLLNEVAIVSFGNPEERDLHPALAQVVHHRVQNQRTLTFIGSNHANRRVKLRFQSLAFPMIGTVPRH
jgi:hypothetical protein